MTRETKAILNMLENEEDIKFYILDRFAGRKIEDEEVFQDTASDLAFVLEDELRSNSRHHFIDISMWGEIVMPYIEKADYKQIAEIWLSRVKESRAKAKTNEN